jgi:hypothetical protein
VSGGLILLFVGPGYLSYDLTPPPAYAAAIAILLGVLVELRALYLALQPPPGIRAAHRAEEGPTLLGTSFVALLVSCLASFGVVPGVYLPSPGSLRMPIVGCGNLVENNGVGGYPDGFPPGSQVHVRWASESGSSIYFRIDQSPLNGPPPNGSPAFWE